MGAHVVNRGCEIGCAERSRPGANALAAEAEPAIDRANRDQLDQDPIRIAMHEPFDRTHRVVANRIVALGGIANEFARVGHELTRDRVGGVVGLDEGASAGVSPIA